jgi:hypothetical protein
MRVHMDEYHCHQEKPDVNVKFLLTVRRDKITGHLLKWFNLPP